MTKTIPSSYERANIIDYRTSSPIAASDGVRWIENQNLLWAKLVADWGAHAFDPAWTTTATSFTQSNDNSTRDLDELNLSGFAQKEDDSSQTDIGIEVFGSNIDLRYSVTNETDSTTIFSGNTLSISGSDDWALRTDTISAQTGDDFLTAQIEAKSPDGNAATLDLIRVGEIEITSTSRLPTS